MSKDSQIPFGPWPPPPIQQAETVPIVPRRPSWADASRVMSLNAVYYPNYRVYAGQTPAMLNYDCISHVYYAFASVNADGTVLLSDEFADCKISVDGVAGCLGSFLVQKQKNPHLKVILSVGGGNAGAHFTVAASCAASRDLFAKSAAALVINGQLDGIDLDWEQPSSTQDGQNFLALLANIRIYLPDDRYLLTAAVPAGQWALKYIDLAKAADYLDLINVMAYDFAGPWSRTAGYHSQLYPANPGEPSGSAAVDYIISTGFPSKKILLGVPVYGRSFLGAIAPGQAYQGNAGDEGTFEYKSLPRPGTAESVDRNACSAYCIGGDGGFVSYDNTETVRTKGGYCRDKQLGGLFYWTGTSDYTRNPRSLIEAGYKALHGQ